MAAVTRRRILALLAGAAILPLTAACEEPEDCDADDLLEGDDDCKPSKAKKTPTKAPTKTPMPRPS
jgi:hypothetical protein